MDWCSLLYCDDFFCMVNNIQQQWMVSLYIDINYVVYTYIEELDNDNKKIYQHFHKNLLITNEEQQQLPIPVYSLLTPMMSLQFMNHIILSFRIYATDLYLSLNGSMREKFQNAELIWMNVDDKYLQIYSN